MGYPREVASELLVSLPSVPMGMLTQLLAVARDIVARFRPPEMMVNSTGDMVGPGVYPSLSAGNEVSWLTVDQTVYGGVGSP